MTKCLIRNSLSLIVSNSLALWNEVTDVDSFEKIRLLGYQEVLGKFHWENAVAEPRHFPFRELWGLHSHISVFRTKFIVK